MAQDGFLGSGTGVGTEALTGDLDDAELGTTPDWFVTRQTILSVTGSIDPIITGLRELHDKNDGPHPYSDKLIRLTDTDPLVLVRWAHLHTDSAAPSRLELPNNIDLLMGPGDTLRCYYDGAGMSLIAVHRPPPPPVSLASISGSVFSSTIGLAATGFRLAETVLFTLTAAATLHGMEAGEGATPALVGFGDNTASDIWLGHRKRKRLINKSAFPLTIPDQSATETEVTNRFSIVGGGPIVLNQHASLDVEYDDTAGVDAWRAV